MQHRAPSVQLAPRAASEIRRRSGRATASSIDEDNPGIYVTEQDPNQGEDINEHTVLLVNNSQVHLAPSAILPFAPTFREETEQTHRQTWDGKPIVPFSPVPLTPLPPPPTSPSSPPRPGLPPQNSTATMRSLVPSLPTPDFGRGGDRRVPGAFMRGLSFISFRIPTTTFFPASGLGTAVPAVAVEDLGRRGSENVRERSEEPETTTTTTSRPMSERTDSEVTTVCSALSSDSTSFSAVDCGRRFRSMAAVGTTSKFTHKWPVPHALRYVDPNDLMDDALAPEEGRGGAWWARGTMQNRWTLFKWCLLLSVATVLVYGTAGLLWAIMTWRKAWNHADIMGIADYDILVLITTAASVTVFAALVGTCGIFLDSRPILATYTILLWVALLSVITAGYASYKRAAFSLDHKLDLAWSEFYTPLDRLVIQNSLQCCGYYSPLHDATPSKWCYPRSSLPGCKGNLYRFEWSNLGMIWSAAFSLALLHLVNLLIALICTNHVTRTFGQGMMPKQYRLGGQDVKDEADKILSRVRAAGETAEVGKVSSVGWFRQDEPTTKED